METAIVPFVQHLYPVVMKAVQDEDDEVASNATYGLGVLAAFGGDAMFAYPFYQRRLKIPLFRAHIC